MVIDEIPETVTGKYTRRIIQKIVNGQEYGDISTLRNPDSVFHLKKALEKLQLETSAHLGQSLHANSITKLDASITDK